MVIEFHNPHKKVNEWLIDYVRDAVIELHNEHREISRAEIYFRERKEKKIQWQICEIHLSIYGNSLTITVRYIIVLINQVITR